MSSTLKPKSLEVWARHIPTALKAVTGWIMWRHELRGDKWTKPPINEAGVSIDAHNSQNWMDFSTAYQAYQKGGFDGIGFSLNAIEDLAGVDLDHCVKGGVIEPWALEIVSELKGYSEISPSGEGIRILGYGKLRRDGRKKGDIEMYDGRRYLTVTGHKLAGGAVDLVDFDTALNRVHDRIWSERPEAPHKTRGDTGARATVPDKKLLKKIRSSKQADDFEALFAGGPGGYPSDSEADLAFCNILAFWCGCDHSQMDRIVRASGRFRDKWDEDRGGRTYGEITIQKAVDGCGEVYSPPPLSEARDLLETVKDGLKADPRKLKDPEVLAALLTLQARDPLEFDIFANDLKEAGVVKLPTLKKMMNDERRRGAEEKAKSKSCTTEEDEDSDEGFCLEDFCYLTDDGKYAFSPTTAATSIITKSKLGMTCTEPDIYRFDGQIYRNDGDRKIDLTICRVAKDLIRGKDVQEVVRRVKNELLEDPVVFDGNPYLLGVKNGVVDLSTGEFRDYQPDDLITYQLDVTCDPTARCPRFVKFLEEIQPDVTDRLTLVDWFPATAIRKPLPYVLFLLGLGRNGKGVYERLVKRFFGAAAFRDMALAEVSKNNFAASAFYKKLGWIATEQSGKKKATIGTDFIKLVTGAGSIDADRKNLSRIQFEAYFQAIVDTNAMPKIEDTSIGWMERFCKQDLPFHYVSNPDPNNPLERKKDPHLYNKLTTDDELSGILNLLIWRAREVCETETITKRPAAELFNEYSQQSASVSTFCDKFLEYEEGLTEPNIPTIDIYQAYKKWCSYLVGEVVDEAYFGRYLKRFCNDRQRSRPRRDDKRLTAYPGLLFYEDKVKIAIEALSKGWTGEDPHGPVMDRKDFSKTDIKCTSGTSGPVELWNQIVKRFGPCGPEVQEDKEDLLSKGEIDQIGGPTGPPVPPAARDPKNGESTGPGPVPGGPLPVQGDEGRGEMAEDVGDSDPSEAEYIPIVEELEAAAGREADYLEHVRTPEPKGRSSAESDGAKKERSATKKDTPGERPSLSEPALKDLLDESGEITPERYVAKVGGTVGAATKQLDLAVIAYGWDRRKIGFSVIYGPGARA